MLLSPKVAERLCFTEQLGLEAARSPDLLAPADLPPRLRFAHEPVAVFDPQKWCRGHDELMAEACQQLRQFSLGLVDEQQPASAVDRYVRCLQDCAAIERHLSDLVHQWRPAAAASSSSSSADQSPLAVPQNMADLLSHAGLLAVVGEDAVFWLTVLFGAPNGLFLRNILWHGFVIPLAALPASYARLVGHVRALLQRRHPLLAHERRPPTTGDFDAQQLNFWGAGPELPDLAALLRSVPAARLALSATRGDGDVDETALLAGLTEAFLAAYERHLGGDEHGALSLCLPALESLLRVLFVQLGSAGVDASQLLASCDQHFLDFDDFLAPGPLVTALGDRTVSALCDLLTYPDGPRVRDRLGHGEWSDSAALPAGVCGAVFEVVAHVLTTLRDGGPPAPFRCPSRFHPRTLVQRTLLDAQRCLRSLRQQLARDWPGFADPVDPALFREFWRGAAAARADALASDVDDWSPNADLATLHLSRDQRSKLTWLRESSTVLLDTLSTVSSANAELFALVAQNTAVERQQRAFDKFVQQGGPAVLRFAERQFRLLAGLVEDLDRQPLKFFRALNTAIQKFKIAAGKNLWLDVERMADETASKGKQKQ